MHTLNIGLKVVVLIVFAERLYFGGGGGFNGGSNYLNLSVAPLVGYRITDRWSSGVRLTYQYVKIGDVRYNNFGGGPFAVYNFTENIFGYTEYEYLKITSPNLEGSLDFSSWFVGVGYTEYLSDLVGFNATVLYNVLYNDGVNSPYGSPLSYRIGFIRIF